ncbi:MAG: hypothetical protein ABSG12_11900 [Steroidobacteraceae bacterium]
MSYIYAGSFIAPPSKRKVEDGRDQATVALKKILARGPRRPDSLAKCARADSEVNAEVAMSLTDNERGRRSHADEALGEIKKAHAAGPRVGPSGPVAQGEEPFRSKSVAMVKQAHACALPVSRSGLPDLERAAALGRVKVDLPALVRGDLRKTPSGEQWRRMTPQERIAWARKGVSLPGEDTDTTDSGAMPRTGASNNWRDETDMGEVRTTRVAGQAIGIPSQNNMQAALDAIKKDLARPKRMLAHTADEE